jgi:hypothetical protein
VYISGIAAFLEIGESELPDWPAAAEFVLAGGIGSTMLFLDLLEGVEDAGLSDTGDREPRVPIGGILYALNKIRPQVHRDLSSSLRQGRAVRWLLTRSR